ILPSSYDADFAQPLYVLKPPVMFEGMAKAISALTDTDTQFRTFDPIEDPRMSLRDAVQQVAVSTGVLCAVISRQIVAAENHNLRSNLGNTAAENEFRRLSDYFVETPPYRSAMAGHGRIVIGRKGSGKTAIFMEMGERLSQGRQNLVLTLRPEGYQLRKFKDN